MGQEIDHTRFRKSDFKRFHAELEKETRLLAEMIAAERCSQAQAMAGFEIEAWLVDEHMTPAPINKTYLETLNDPLATTELAKFNIELNTPPQPLTADGLRQLHREVDKVWQKASATAETLGIHLLMTGILPTIEQAALNLNNMSEMNRYRALNEQILRSRGGEPIHLEICGHQHLKLDHRDVMLESAATSFQVHLQTPLSQAHQYYNASIIASAPLVAASANSPFLFGHDLWMETRIPLFEQSIETGGYAGAARGPLRRVSFGSSYAQQSIMECFEENLNHFPVLLPIAFSSPREAFDHLRLHNGTIWRWNRPLVGFDQNGIPHIRIEHRVMAAAPSIIDTIANAAFFYGLTAYLRSQAATPALPFAQSKDNFYRAARSGLDARILWLDGKRHRLQNLILEHLIEQARDGLDMLGIAAADSDDFLAVIQQRVASGQVGSVWQRATAALHAGDFRQLTAIYLDNQKRGRPVHEWDLC